MMIGEDFKYLCAMMNAKLIHWYLQQIAPTSGMGTLLWKKVYVETIPIPLISTELRRPFVLLVEDILAAKATAPSADICDQEEEIDRLIYELYGLSEEEIAIVEQSTYLTRDLPSAKLRSKPHH